MTICQQFERFVTQGFVLQVLTFSHLCIKAELKKVLTFRVANLPDYRRVALQTFRIACGLSFFKTFRVALLPRYPGFF